MTIEFWYLIGAALVFWMQAGFAMVETGFTRAKNAGNIIMKNLMKTCQRYQIDFAKADPDERDFVIRMAEKTFLQKRA